MGRSTDEASREIVEGRTLGKFNLKEETSMEPSESQITTATKLARIAWLSAKDPNKEWHQLMHHFNEESLTVCFHELYGRKAVGVDEVTKSQYGERLSENIKELVASLKRMSYRPGPVREVRIPKEGKSGETRPLGISNFEDKLVQKMIQKVLESIYEPIFLDCSYGFRRGRGCHDAIRALDHYLFANDVEIILDVDLENFFGTIDHKLVEEILREKIKDQKFMRYIIRLFKAGLLSGNELVVSDEGVAQGSVCSPMIANIFAHYVIDKWFQEVVKQHCKGKVELFRYADDMVVCCQYQKDAERIRQALKMRLSKYKLKLNEDKTKNVLFSKRRFSEGEKQGAFDFLGFTFHLGKSRKGVTVPKLRTSGKRFRSKLKNVKIWAKSVRNKYRLRQIWKMFCIKLEGHIRYYGVSGNYDGVNRFQHESRKIMFKWLNRRSQKRSFNWEKFQLFEERFPPPTAKIHHRLFCS